MSVRMWREPPHEDASLANSLFDLNSRLKFGVRLALGRVHVALIWKLGFQMLEWPNFTGAQIVFSLSQNIAVNLELWS